MYIIVSTGEYIISYRAARANTEYLQYLQCCTRPRSLPLTLKFASVAVLSFNSFCNYMHRRHLVTTDVHRLPVGMQPFVYWYMISQQMEENEYHISIDREMRQVLNTTCVFTSPHVLSVIS